MCSVLRHPLNMSIPTLPCPRMPIETESPRRVRRSQRTPVSLSLGGEKNCAASLFVRFFTSLLMSTHIKMTVHSEGSGAQLTPNPPPLFHFTRNENAMWAETPAHMVIWVRLHAHTCMRFLNAVTLERFWEWEGTSLRSKNFHSGSRWLSDHAFPPS